MTKILDGRIVRDKIAKDLTEKIKSASRLNRIQPKLVIIQVGNLPESTAYIKQKLLFGQKIGAVVNHQVFPETIDQQSLIAKIREFNADPTIHGIIVQLPLPGYLDKDAVIDTINPEKDIDGLTSFNLKLLWGDKPQGYIPATTRGILTLLDYYKIPVAGKKVVIVGRSFLVGKPTVLALLNRDATVTVCHRKTKSLKLETRNCDILIVAAGQPKLITKDYVSKDQVVVDVGINVANDKQLETGNWKPETEITGRQLVGDVDFESVSKIVKAISPVPGGIGPMTVVSLFQNLLAAYYRQIKLLNKN